MENKQLISGSEHRFVAADMTQALRQLTEKLGSDAILLSSRKIAEGVEVIGLSADAREIPNNLNQLHTERRVRDRRRQPRSEKNDETNQELEAANQSAQMSELAVSPQTNSKQVATGFAGDLRKTAAELAKKISHLTSVGSEASPARQSNVHQPQAPQSAVARSDQHVDEVDTGSLSAKVSSTERVNHQHESENILMADTVDIQAKKLNSSELASEQLSTMTQELKTLKQLIASSMEKNAEDFLPKPHEYVVLNRLLKANFDQPLARALVQTAHGSDVESLWRDCLRRLKSLIATVSGVEASRSGIIAVVGARASGKTETVIKLAAKLALQYGRQSVVVIAAKAHCTEASALQRMERLTNIALLPIARDVDWVSLLESCAKYRFVLIDTSATNDFTQAQWLRDIRQSGMPVDEVLVLPANAQKGYLRQLIAEFRHANTLSTIATFYDQCMAKGELLSVLVYEKLSVMYQSTGVLLPAHLKTFDCEQFLQDVFDGEAPASDEFSVIFNQQRAHSAVANGNELQAS